MFFAPWLGLWTPFTASSTTDATIVYPGIRLRLFASITASLTPLAVGTPSDASPPDRGRSAPIFTTAPPAEPLGALPEHPARLTEMSVTTATTETYRAML